MSSRRKFIGFGLATVAELITSSAMANRGVLLDLQRAGQRKLFSVDTEEGLRVASWLMRDLYAGNQLARPHPKLLTTLSQVQARVSDVFKYTVFELTSGYRTESTNASLPNAAASSYHLTDPHGYFHAVDFVPIGASKEQVISVLRQLHFGGVGVYATHIHFDCRPNKTLWVA